MSISFQNIRSCKLFDGLDDRELETLQLLFTEHQMGEGKTVFVENMAAESLYLITRGTVAVFKMLAEGEEKTLAVLGAGELFGEMALFDNTPRAATARVAESATILSIKKSSFDAFCQNNPAVALKLLRNIVKIFCAQLRETDGDFRNRFKVAFSEMN
ncbi:MAG: cyclic nucleotide-binding domain-containing protein [Desulfuromonadales bacterium]|nr:cyclic nucleotide-binding domain-containing protein [Desulfuromonadales bacterium]MDT8423082.1 cyclic nucleotide-binding domain-containing protein [Desulfuromonadales bacterium]